jgi:hypothetical protein
VWHSAGVDNDTGLVGVKNLFPSSSLIMTLVSFRVDPLQVFLQLGLIFASKSRTYALITSHKQNDCNTVRACPSEASLGKLLTLQNRQKREKITGTNTLAFYPGNTKGGSITVPLTSCLTGLESAV